MKRVLILRWIAILWWLPAALAVVAIAAVLAACGASLKPVANCRPDRGLAYVRVQSSNVLVIVCRDGQVYRYDTNRG